LRFLVLSDIHGNRVALRAILGEAPTYDGIVCLGDYLWTSLGNLEIVQWVQQMRKRLGEYAVLVRGNSDTMEYYNRYGSLSREDPSPLFEYLQALPTQVHLSVEGHTLLAVHSFPKPDEFVSAFEERRSLLPRMRPRYLKEVLPLEDVQVLLFGDIHLPYVASHRGLLVLDPGSVGFNLDGDPRASYMILDIQEDGAVIEHRRTEYDVEKACTDVVKAHANGDIGWERGQSFRALIKGGKMGPFTWRSEWNVTMWNTHAGRLRRRISS